MDTGTGADGPLIKNFENGLDAIELMIRSFGFDNIEMLRTAPVEMTQPPSPRIKLIHDSMEG